MENNLADQLIAANKEERDTGPEVDEYGIPLPVPKTKQAHYNYLVARAFVINPHLHTRFEGNQVWNGHTQIHPTIKEIARLTKWVDELSGQGAVYVYDKIKELAPKLNDDVIAISPHLAWDTRKRELIESKEGFNVISDW